jgi:hypothetical protein
MIQGFFLRISRVDAAIEQLGAQVGDLARTGLVLGQDFDPSKLCQDQIQALNSSARAAY